MKNKLCLFPCILLLLFANACRNKTVVLLTKKWDCIQIEQVGLKHSINNPATDSAHDSQLKELAKSISWTFSKNMRYECSLNNRVTVSGKYELLENDRVIVCRPESKKIANRYIIKSLTADELILRGNTDEETVTLHFTSH